MKRVLKIILCTCIVLMNYAPAIAGELLVEVKKIASARQGEIPQAPRVSPDGKGIVFEYYAKDKTVLWHAAADGTGAACWTCDLKQSLENGSWHPSGKYLLFNEVPEGNARTKGIYAAAVEEGNLTRVTQIAVGARPQFSRPNGHVIFFETSQTVNGKVSNILAYKILGSDPLAPTENMNLELRGPIQLLNQSAEISHPSLAPDGTTIVFAARTVNLEATNGWEGGLVMNDTDRQKVYKLWKALIPVDKKKIENALQTVLAGGIIVSRNITPAIGHQAELTLDDFDSSLSAKAIYSSTPTIIPGYTTWHLFLAWTLGLLDKLDNKYDSQIQEMIFPRLWTTDVFGAPITPLVKDMSSTPLPQKWPTVSYDGRFVVFEAGLYSNRHIYLVARKKKRWMDKAAKTVGMKPGDEWMEKAIKLTELGTYNSSPELDPTGQWLYFESNRDGAKGIWRAKLNWEEINKRLGL